MIPASLSSELSASPGRFGLIEAAPYAGDVITEWELALGAPRSSVGTTLTSLSDPPSSSEIEVLLNNEHLLVDLEILFAPQLALDPVALLRRLARRLVPRLALWPGRLVRGRAQFSELQRPDHYDRLIEDVLILRPMSRSFPDQPSFEIERWLK
ncbi:MAG: hypothetical protein ACLPY3_08965 [Solirubrobacteraceae bacterium]